MDIFEHARHHHRRAVGLVAELQGLRDPAQCREKFSRLQDELRAHERIEADLLYPVLRESAHMPVEIGGLLSGHTRIKALTARIAAARPCSEQWREAVEALASSLGRHVIDEEEDVFPRARDVVDDATLNEISAAADHAAADNGAGRHDDPGGAVAEQLRQPARRAGEQVGRLRGEAERKLTALVSEQGRTLAGQGHEFAAALRETGENLRRRDAGGGLPAYVAEAADSIDEWMSRIEDEDPRRLLSLLDDAARRNPALVFGGALGAGFLLSRFTRSSAARAEGGPDESPADWGAEYERVDRDIGMEAGMPDFGSEP